MKKLLIVFLALILILGGLFIWKGGHHAIVLAEVLEEWLDADDADQTLSATVNDTSFAVDTFWTELGERTVYGLSAGGYTAYLDGTTLCMDSGTAYSLPELRDHRPQLREFLTALVLYGRVTKTEQTYHLEMEHEELAFAADITVNKGVSAVSLNLSCTLDGQLVQIDAVVTPKQTQPHPLPRAVLEAMVRSKIEPPIAITQPLETLIPAFRSLMPLQADVTMGVECGILSISETAALTAEDGAAYLIRNGTQIPLKLPGGLMKIDPIMMAFVVLRNGSFRSTGVESEFLISLPPEATAELTAQLVPQVRELGLSFEESSITLRIRAGKLTSADLHAGGSIPFLITTIPLEFSAEFRIT